MFPTFAHVTAYPLVFPLFYGAVVIFALVMARHLRIFAVARPSRPFANVPRRVVGFVEYALAHGIRRMMRLREVESYFIPPERNGEVVLQLGHGSIVPTPCLIQRRIARSRNRGRL